jgi:hypothetical protein
MQHRKANMSSIPAAQTDRLRLMQRLFVQAALAEAIGPHSDTGSLDELVTSVARRCCENFSEPVVRELIIEIAEKLGYEGSAE